VYLEVDEDDPRFKKLFIGTDNERFLARRALMNTIEFQILVEEAVDEQLNYLDWSDENYCLDDLIEVEEKEVSDTCARSGSGNEPYQINDDQTSSRQPID